MNMNYNRSYQQ
jgi:hypothetical protein